MTIKSIEKAILYHQNLYDKGKPKISDKQFDVLVANLQRRSPDSPVLDQLGKPLRTEKIQHHTSMLSLQKFYVVANVETWGKKTGETLFAIQPKYDGVALSLRYEKGKLVHAATRGDGEEGDDVTRRALLCPDIPKRIKERRSVEIRGELIMQSTVFEDMFEGEFANARNAVAGNLMRRSGRTDVIKACSFFAYDLLIKKMFDFDTRMKALGDLKFMPTHTAFVVSTAVGEKLNAFSKSFREFDYAMDGLVIKVCSYKIQEEVGYTSHHSRWACALKFRGDTARTTILDVTWQVSRNGTLTPVAELDPVDLDGVTISRATLHHLGRFRMFAPRKGDVVTLARRGGVIPHIEAIETGKGKKIKVPKVCPSCEGSLRVEKDFLKCCEPECDSALIRKLRHWANTTGMDCWGPEVIQALYDAGDLTHPDGFYELGHADIERLDGFGMDSSTTLIEEMEKTRSMPLDTLITALGIPLIGKTIAKRIAKAIPDIESFGFVDMDVPGVGQSRINALRDWIIDHGDLLERLLEVVDVIPIVRPDIEGPLAGKNFVFTGRLSDMERSEAQHLVCKYGGDVAGGVTKATNYLVVGDLAKDSQLTKRNKAEKYGVTIISETEFASMLAEAMTENE